MMQLSLSIVQKLITYDLVQDVTETYVVKPHSFQKYYLQILVFLGSLLETQDESIQIKLLQTSLLFITPKKIDMNLLEFVQKVNAHLKTKTNIYPFQLLNLLLQMMSSKNVFLTKPTSAALFQLSGIIYDQLIVSIKNQNQQIEKSNIYQYNDLYNDLD